jgi:predicted nucleic acid-binding protein
MAPLKKGDSVKIVIDSNVLFSALIRDSTTRKLILEYDGKFLFPSFIFSEMEKHKGMLISKSGIPKEEFDILLSIILAKVTIIPDSMLLKQKKKALILAKKTDIDDLVFFACALSYKGSVLWSNDKRLKKQRKIKVLNTKEIMDLIGT